MEISTTEILPELLFAVYKYLPEMAIEIGFRPTLVLAICRTPDVDEIKFVIVPLTSKIDRADDVPIAKAPANVDVEVLVTARLVMVVVPRAAFVAPKFVA